MASSSPSPQLGGNEATSWPLQRMRQALDARDEKGTRRRLPCSASSSNPSKHLSNSNQDHDEMWDFSSNDYLGLAHSVAQHAKVQARYDEVVSQLPTTSTNARDDDMNNSNNNSKSNNKQAYFAAPVLGSTGSRLLSGDSSFVQQLERRLCTWHGRSTALVANSGYDANLLVMSSLPGDLVLYDALIHNSLHMGLRLWQSQSQSHSHSNLNSTVKRRAISFQHNNVQDLIRKLQQYSCHNTSIMIVVESVYSMDGDLAPLKEILHAAKNYGAHVVVDEAHAVGIYGAQGTGLLAHWHLEHDPHLFASIYTMGKGAGCHGAVVCGATTQHRDYWINYGYPLIYSTALPLHSLVVMEQAYETFTGDTGRVLRQQLQHNIVLFKRLMSSSAQQVWSTNATTKDGSHVVRLLPSYSPIQALCVPGNDTVTQFCQRVFQQSQHRIRLFPIKSPTVPAGQERVRIVLHAHNTTAQIQQLVQLLLQTLQAMQQTLVVVDDQQKNHIPPSRL